VNRNRKPGPASSDTAPLTRADAANIAGSGTAGVSGVSFEDALTQLETIVERIESGDIPLERAIAEYERGVGLVRQCRSILSNAEQKIEELNLKLAETNHANTAASADGDRDGEDDESDESGRA
jgi:exodeoxyribonuclease VII small subunit